LNVWIRRAAAESLGLGDVGRRIDAVIRASRASVFAAATAQAYR
jgi:hypothetical protein